MALCFGRDSWLLVLLIAIGSSLWGCDSSNDDPSLSGTPETTLPGSAAPVDRSLRVLVRDRIANCHVSVPGSFNLVDVATGEVLVEDRSVHRLLVEFTENSVDFPDLQQSFGSETIDLRPHEQQPVWVDFEEDGWRSGHR